jgi:surface carbohydrate biosynthesis protein
MGFANVQARVAAQLLSDKPKTPNIQRRSAKIDPGLPLLIPVEIASRELDAKILFGLFAAERGHDVILGHGQPLKSPLLPRSIFFSKNVRRHHAVYPQYILGHSVVALDEEGLVRFPDEFQNMRLETEALDIIRMLFAWGRSNAQHWTRLPNYDGTPIIETGNPRVDLLRPELRGFHDSSVEQLQARYGRYILVNTNFSIVNHFMRNYIPVKRPPNIPAEVFQHASIGVKQHKMTLMRHFLDLVPRLASAIAPTKLILRPHPSENHEPWKDALRGLSNADVVFEGGVVPWLIAAQCVIHNGCTTAIEASLLGTPPIAFRPVCSSKYDLHLPNDVSIQCKSVEDVIESVRIALRGADENSSTHTIPGLLQDHIAGLDGQFACERILNAIESRAELLIAPPPPRPALNRVARVVAYGMGELGRRFPITARLKYTRHVFPGMPAAEILNKVKTISNVLKRFDDIKISFLRDDAVRFHPPGF